eukprot:580165-Ditylum_brightwellii.AAC.1
MTSVQDPVKCSIGWFFYCIDQGNWNLTDFLTRNRYSQYGAISPDMGDFQLAYTSMIKLDENNTFDPDDLENIKNSEGVHEVVQKIIHDYDFIFNVERFEERLVAMQLMLGMAASNILYLSAKQSGSYTMKNGATKQCH